MAELEVKKNPIEDVHDNSSDKSEVATETNKRESLEDLLTTLSHQINNSDWLQVNTAEKFAATNPEVAKAFIDAASKSCQHVNGDVKGDNV